MSLGKSRTRAFAGAWSSLKVAKEGRLNLRAPADRAGERGAGLMWGNDGASVTRYATSPPAEPGWWRALQNRSHLPKALIGGANLLSSNHLQTLHADTPSTESSTRVLSQTVSNMIHSLSDEP
jgi:hypothetical protein